MRKPFAPSFYSVHWDIQDGKHTYYDLFGGRGSTKSSFIGVELPLGIMTDPLANAIVFRKVASTIGTSVFEQVLWGIDALGPHPDSRADLFLDLQDMLAHRVLPYAHLTVEPHLIAEERHPRRTPGSPLLCRAPTERSLALRLEILGTIHEVCDRMRRQVELVKRSEVCIHGLNERASKVDQHFTLAQKDMTDLETSISKITPRAEKLRDMDFGEE